jgi:hypothetical protein
MSENPTIGQLFEIITQLQAEVKELKKENASLHATVNDLMDRNSKLQNRKNSNNSSIPPSKDENRPRRTKSLRKPSGRKPGGQKGRKGSTLEMSAEPGVVIDHKPGTCAQCGLFFEAGQMELIGKRQVIDIPPIIPEYTEHRVYSARCSCGHVTKQAFPSGVNSPISYGASFSLSFFQHGAIQNSYVTLF